MSALIDEMDMGKFSTAFKDANNLYKSGAFDKVKTRYEDILEKCPVHLGARNNYVLTLVQLGEYQPALVESILLGLIHPDYKGNWVNILIPLYALGYGGSTAPNILEGSGMPASPGYDPGNVSSGSLDEIDAAFLYNYVYAYMETEISEYELETRMKEFESVLLALKAKSPEDTDYSELLEYLEGLAIIRVK